MKFTLSVKSFHVPATPLTVACPPSSPSVPTSRATRVTSDAKELSWSTIVFTVFFNSRISPFTSTVTFFERSPRATAVVTPAMLRTCAVRFAAIVLTLLVRSFHVPATPCTSACPPSFPSLPTSRATRVTSDANKRSRSTIVLMMELSSLERFNSTHQAFLDQLTESIGIVLNTIEANTRTENLLKQSQSLATELQNRQDELQKTNLELAEKARSNLAKDQFLAMLSHELRTPLTPVLASAVALESEPALPQEIHDSLQMIRRNVELEARLIDDLLDLTRIDRGKVQLNFEVVDAHTLLQSALDICQAEIDRKQLVCSLHLRAQNVHLHADPARLQQIFWNLINNAVKFTPKDGWISISTSNDSKGQLRVEIADSGLGIEPESLPKIFDAFEQGGGTQLVGLGLGLAISKALVEAHQGTITAQSAGQHKGATFTLAFPTCEKTESRIAPAALPGVPARHTKRILLVEDHEDTNRSLTNLLRRRGYQVHSALNFQSALDLSAKEKFDVLISDLALPDGSGIDLIRTLHSNRPVLGIALTGFGMEEDIRRGREAGFQHHLVKPIDLNKLDLLIQESAKVPPTP